MKQIVSPVERFPGTVMLPDAFDWDQLAAWEASIEDTSSAKGTIGMLRAQVRALVGMGLVWHIRGIPEAPTPETFPTRPLAAISELIAWLFREVTRKVMADDPNP